jgi:hypothetical protein
MCTNAEPGGTSPGDKEKRNGIAVHDLKDDVAL